MNEALPLIPRPLSLLAVLLRSPARPASVCGLVRPESGYPLFRTLLRRLLPGREAEILSAGSGQADPESVRMWAFSEAISEEYCPISRSSGTTSSRSAFRTS